MSDRSTRVLLMDDYMPMRLHGRKALEREQYVVYEAENGEDALQAFEQHKPDLVLLDIVMPGMDGFAVCEKIRQTELGKHVPILVMTGLEDIKSINRAYEIGATDFVPKPINWVMLCHRLRYILRSSRAMQRLNHAITELRISEHRLARAQRLARLGHWVLDTTNGRMTWSEQVFSILGVEPSQAPQRMASLYEYIYKEDQEVFRASLDKAIEEHTPWQLEHRIQLADGEVKAVVHYAEFNYEHGNGAVLNGIIQDITERKRSEARIRYLAYYDNLTGLPNRRCLQEYLSEGLISAKRNGATHAILFIKVDRVKRINDTFGHNVGDELIKQVSVKIKDSIEYSEYSKANGLIDKFYIARFGGAEFIVLISAIPDSVMAGRVAQEIVQAFDKPIKFANRELQASVNVGISIAPNDGDTPMGLLKNADSAVCHAKESGSGFCFYSDSMNFRALEKFTLEVGLRRAVEKQEFLPYYQPILDLRTNQIIGAELLLRWQHPEMGFIPPAQFIPVAEDSGLIIPIGEWVARTACEQMKAWLDMGYQDMYVAINLSAKQFWQYNLVTEIEKIVKQVDVDPRHLELELTESVVMRNEIDAISMLHDLKKMRLRLSIDDFGTGYSSLSYLRQFPIDTLKIDRSFIKEINQDSDSQAIAAAIIAMAHNLKLRVVAEGVEHEEQLVLLRRLGCDAMQGFYFSRPVPVDRLTALLKQNNDV